jgi:hypothetical protein
VLEDCTGCLLLISHDRALLDRMDRIAELDRGELRSYGGNFTEYTGAVRAGWEIAEKNIRNAEQEVKREKREMQQARERAARRASNAARNLNSAGLPKIFAGTMKRGAQQWPGSRTRRTPRGSAKPGPGSMRRAALSATSRRSRWNCRRPMSQPGARSFLANGSRCATASGPSSPPVAPVAYLSQRLDLLDLDRTVAENLAAFAPGMPEAQDESARPLPLPRPPASLWWSAMTSGSWRRSG